MFKKLSKKLTKNLRSRYTLYFFGTVLIACIISSLLAYFYLNSHFGSETEQIQQDIVEALTDVSGDAEIFISLPSSYSYDLYNLEKIEETAPKLQKYIDRLQNGEVIVAKHWLLPTVTTYFMIDGDYYQLSQFSDSSLGAQITISLLAAIGATIVLGTLLATFMGKRFLRPIRELCAATNELAKGNFDVRVKPSGDNEIGQLVRNFNQMADDLGSIETLQREFTGNFSHEFKTPLASINGFAKLLSAENVSEEERREYASIISEESERLSKLATSILALTKLENQQTLPTKNTFSLDEQLRRVIVTTEPQWNKKRLNMEIELDDVDITSCEELLSDVWFNLLGNAIKFTDVEGQITIRLYETLDHIVVEFEDDGIGMDEKTLKRIFDKFYQGDASHSSEGNGLGLALVKRIVELCGGGIIAESEPDIGSLFRVTLPKD